MDKSGGGCGGRQSRFVPPSINQWRLNTYTHIHVKMSKRCSSSSSRRCRPPAVVVVVGGGVAPLTPLSSQFSVGKYQQYFAKSTEEDAEMIAGTRTQTHAHTETQTHTDRRTTPPQSSPAFEVRQAITRRFCLLYLPVCSVAVFPPSGVNPGRWQETCHLHFSL